MLSYLKRNPILSAFLILIIAFLLRLNDLFILKIDELFGEIFVSKTLGFLVILLFIVLIKERFSTIGLHKRSLWFCIGLGFSVNLGIYLLAYAIEYGVLRFSNQSPSLLFSSIDPKQGVNGGILFGIWLVVGNIINALMEEGLFRGVFLPVLKTRYTFWKANLFQAFLFGIWHLVWPLKNFLTGEQSLAGALMNGLILMLGTVTFGFIWGVMFQLTNSLWTSIAAHFAANTIQNILHINSMNGLDTMAFLRGTAASLVGLACLFFIKWITSRHKLPVLRAWGEGSASTMKQ